jgi:hypothetical protein
LVNLNRGNPSADTEKRRTSAEITRVLHRCDVAYVQQNLTAEMQCLLRPFDYQDVAGIAANTSCSRHIVCNRRPKWPIAHRVTIPEKGVWDIAPMLGDEP